MKIAFAGTPDFAQKQLQALIDASFEIAVVYTQPDKPHGRGQKMHESEVKQLAKAYRLPIEQPLTLKDPQALAQFQHYQPDVMVVASYGLILPQAFLEIPRHGCINVHASLLPQYRGASPIQQAILNGDSETGITLMRMAPGLDTGPILIQEKCAITATETSLSLYDKLALLGAKTLQQHLAAIVDKPGTPQDEHLATYAKKITKQEAFINWHDSAQIIERKIRAFNPWPIAHTEIETVHIRIWQAHVVSLSSTAAPGTIIDVQPQGIVVATPTNALLITQAQLPGKKVMPFTEIYKGHSALFAKGQCFKS